MKEQHAESDCNNETVIKCESAGCVYYSCVKLCVYNDGLSCVLPENFSSWFIINAMNGRLQKH